jgi:hypothetical protein
MAQWHLLEKDTQGYRIVYHLPIPATNNAAGLSRRTVLLNSREGGRTQLPDGDGTGGTISAAEKNQIIVGELYEATVYRAFPDSLTPVQLAAAIDADWTNTRDTLRDALNVKLNQYGRTSTG